MRSQDAMTSILKHYVHMRREDNVEFMRELEAIVPSIQFGDEGIYMYSTVNNARSFPNNVGLLLVLGNVRHH